MEFLFTFIIQSILLTTIIDFTICSSEEKYSFHITRSSKGDIVRSEGFQMEDCSRNKKQDMCKCPKNKFFFLQPKLDDNDDEDEYLYDCIKNHSDVNRAFRLFNQNVIPTLEYKNNSWKFPFSSLIARRQPTKLFTCTNKMKIIEVQKMGYFEWEEMTEHPFSLQKQNKNTYSLVIDQDTSQEDLEGDLIQIIFSCRKMEASLLLKFEGERTISGHTSPISDVYIATTPRTRKSSPVTPIAKKQSSDTNIALIVGVTVGCVGVFLIIIALVVFFCVLRQAKPVVVQENRRDRSSSAPPAYPGLDMVPPSYELPRKPSIFDYTQEGLLIKSRPSIQIPKRTPSPLPPTPPSYLDNPTYGAAGNDNYEKPVDEHPDDTYASLYLKMVDDSDDADGDEEVIKRSSVLELENQSKTESRFDDELPSSLPTMSPLSPLYRVLDDQDNSFLQIHSNVNENAEDITEE